MKLRRKRYISKTRKIIGDVLLVLCALVTAYFMAVMIYRLMTVVDAKKWSAVTRFLAEFGIMSLFSLPAIDIRFGLFSWRKNGAVKGLGIIVRAVSWIICLAFLTLDAAVIITGAKTDETPVESVCVLGLAIEGDELPKDLEHRLDRALEYKAEHPDTLFVVTGGNSEDPYYSEAEQMRRYLIANGFDTATGQLIAETNAKTTVENFKYSAAYVNKEEPLGVVTSNLHMFRATGIARKQGYTSLVKIPAPSEPLLYCENVMWESICSLFQILGGGIAL